jgi:1,4-alpha-glucan branching enzyme
MIKREVSKKDGTTKVTFILPSEIVAQPVSVVGEFNDWDAAAGKLAKRSNGTASTSYSLKPGSYRFRYHRADGTWFNDEDADGYVANQYGSTDCVINL